MKKRVIAAFDFDCTITDRDTFLPFMRFVVGTPTFVLKLIKLSPVFIKHITGNVPRTVVKKEVIKEFLAGKKANEINSLAKEYSQTFAKLLRQEAKDRIKWHKSQGHVVILVSASLEHYLEPWANSNGFDYVFGTKLEIDNEGKLTGALKGSNCYGPEKVNRILEVYPNKDELIVYAYGDSKGDKELLEFAHHSYLRTWPNDENL